MTEFTNSLGSQLKPSRREAAARRRRRAVIDPATDWETAALRRRSLCGLWSARVALVLSVPFAVTAWAGGANDAWLVYMLLPVVASFFAGSLFGAAILDKYRITDASLAGRQGVLVTIVAFLFFALEVAAMSNTPLHTALDYFMGGVLLTGWVAFPAGFFAGVMAFRAREGATKYVAVGHANPVMPGKTAH